MPFSTLKRNKNVIINLLQEDPSGGMIAKDDLQIIIPVRYEEADLAIIENEVTTLGIFAISNGTEYAVNNVPSRIVLSPSEIEKVKYEEHDYYVLKFDKGSTITENMNLIQDETLSYYIYNYFIALGKVPWYMSGIDMINLFKNVAEYTGKSYDPVIMEMIVSMIMRNDDNIHDYWRQIANKPEDLYNRKPLYIPLKSIAFGARNTTAKLMGSYFNEGLNSALVNPSDNTERVEELLRQ